MIYPEELHRTASEHHAQLLAEAERARLGQARVVLVLIKPALKREGLRIALLRLLLWPSRVSVVST